MTRHQYQLTIIWLWMFGVSAMVMAILAAYVDPLFWAAAGPFALLAPLPWAIVKWATRA